MENHWAIPLVFGILFFSTVFSAQDVYGPHYTNFDGVVHHYQGAGQFSQFDVSILISEGLGNPKKNANFEVCVRLDTATDTRTVPIEIVSMNLRSCQPLTVGGQETDLNFLRVLVPVTGDPVFTPSMIVDISGSYEIFNPAGKSMTGEIDIFAEDVVLDILACIPPTCSGDDGNGCGPNGTCVADDVCECDDGWHGEFCQVPDCKSNVDCSDDDACTLEVCRDDGTCAIAPIPNCDPNNRCTSNEQCTSPDECTVGFCDSIGNCQVVEIPGCVPTIPCDDPNCEECLPSNPGFCEQCRDGFIADAAGQCGACDPTAVEVCDGLDNDCDGLVDEQLARLCGVSEGVCQQGIQVCSDGVWSTCNDTPPEPAESCDGLDNDCDGTTDEDFGTGEICTVGLGQCQRSGTVVCDASGEGTTCSATPGLPSAEACNGIDDDCDGLVDNDLAAPSCVLQQGVCAGSVQTCGGSAGFLACTAANYGSLYESVETTCDDTLDNDCDGLEDSADPDCSVAGFCGDGIRQGNEICDAGAENGQTTCGCQEDCTFGNASVVCDDGQFCTSGEVCDGQGNCGSGGPTCTDGTCDETEDVCKVPSADLVVEKRFLSVDPDTGVVSFQVTIHNRGPDTTSSILLRDDVRFQTTNEGISFVSFSMGDVTLECSVNQSSSVCRLGALPTGETFVVTVEIADPNRHAISNIASVSTNFPPDPIEDNNFSEVPFR